MIVTLDVGGIMEVPGGKKGKKKRVKMGQKLPQKL